LIVRTCRRIVVAFACAFGALGVHASEPAPDPDTRARSILEQSARFISAAPQLRLRAKVAWDVILETGERVEMGSTRTITIRRPDRGRVSGERRDGGRMEFFFDGQTATTYRVDRQRYARVELPGRLDAALDHLLLERGFRAPLAALTYSDLAAVLLPRAETARYIGLETLDGVRCHHLAFGNPDIDWQLWVEEGKRPVFCRLVVVYKTDPGAPKFCAKFAEWDLSPEVPDSLFEFSPPEGAQEAPLEDVPPDAMQKPKQAP
jgi:hypothetical protein